MSYQHSFCLAVQLFCICTGLYAPAHGQKATKTSLRLTAPNGGEVWCAGSKHSVTWNAGPLPVNTTVKIEYSTDGGQNWIEVASSRTKSRFLWKVPNRISKQCKVRLTASHNGQSVQSSSSFSIIASQRVVNYRWTNVTRNAAYAARDGAGALTFKNRMWLLGGWNPRDKVHFPRICNNEVWNSQDGITWSLVKPNTFLDDRFDSARDWEGRHTAGYVVYKDKMWIVGGDVNQGHYQNDVWNSADGKIWSYVNKGRNVPWGPRALHYTLAFKDKIWIMGGQTMPGFAPSKEVFYRDVWTTQDGIKWSQVVPKQPSWSARGMIGGNVVFKDRMWFLGGGTYDTPKTRTRKFYNDVWSSADGLNWTRHVEFAAWEPRQYHEVAVFDNRMWVLEGYNKKSGNRKDVWYSTDGVNWYELPNTPWKPRHAASVFVYNNALWMVAGNNMEKDVWKLQRSPNAATGNQRPQQ